MAIVVKGYPRLSETFIAQEILGLQRRGQRQIIVSLRRPTDRAVNAINGQIAAPVLYLPEYLHDDWPRVFRGLLAALGRRGFWRALAVFLGDLARDFSRHRGRRFGQAWVMARELPAETGWLHAHYLHTPASATYYAALIRGLGWSFSAHAKDIWTTPEPELRRKLRAAAWGVTCTAVNHAHLTRLSERPETLALIYHGLDFARFPAAAAPRPPRDGGGDPVRLLSVCRAVEKKGLDVLLAALARLPASLSWRFEHIGGGELLAQLQAQAAQLGLGARIDWRGALDQNAVIAAYQAADLFVLPARVAADGDRDGLPNVLMEAQATGLCCLATSFSAIPELIADGVTGRLVPPADAAALAEALAQLIGDPAARARLGAAGAARVRHDFDFGRGLAQLAARFGL